MVLDTGRPMNRKSTIWPGMRGRDAARKLIVKVNFLQVFTIDVSETESIVNHNSQSLDRAEVHREVRTGKNKITRTISLYRGIEMIPRTIASHLEKVRQKRACATSTRFSSCSLSQKTVCNRGSGEQVAEPISPQRCRRWHSSSSDSWWDTSDWNWWSSFF